MGVTGEGKNRLLATLLNSQVKSAADMNQLAARIRAFGFEYGFVDSELRYRAYEVMLGITREKTVEAQTILNQNSKTSSKLRMANIRRTASSRPSDMQRYTQKFRSFRGSK